jgi:hypothetical protein
MGQVLILLGLNLFARRTPFKHRMAESHENAGLYFRVNPQNSRLLPTKRPPIRGIGGLIDFRSEA